MKVLVCGGRDFSDIRLLYQTLDALHATEGPIEYVIHGCARGADSLAHDWALTRRVAVAMYPAQWNRDGKAAGPIRNQKMLDEGKPDLVIAFPGGRGTADMARRAEAAGVKVRRIA